MKGLRIEFLRRKISRSRKSFWVRFLLHVKCAHRRLSVYGCPIGIKLFALCGVLQSHVRSEEAVDELAFLILGVGKEENGKE